MLIYSIVVVVVMLIWLGIVIYIHLTGRRANDAPAMNEPWPPVSIIVPAMNEEGTIEAGMRSLLALDYPALEIIAVDDRSTDATGVILDRLSEEFPDRLRTLHLTSLPDGWLGKCNALQAAAQEVAGEWILFTDADVILQPHALRTAVAYATVNGADHIVLFPRMLWKGYVEAALLSLFSMTFVIGFQIWRIETKSLRAFMGVGAFNMIRRSLYESFGGHLPLRLEVADDVKLGYLAKKHGGRSMAVNSDGQVQVRWREGVLDTVAGLERSGFAGLDFNWFKLGGAVFFCLFVLLAPYLLPIIAPAAEVITLSIAAAVTIMIIYAINARAHSFPFWIGLLHPLATLLYAYAFIRSAVVTSIRGGLSWRGTFYSIDELKRGTVK